MTVLNDAYFFFISIFSRSVKESVRGPLAMWPAADDNYGSDACALLCLAVSPPVLVVARQQGCIHHALLLPRAQDQELDDRHLNMPDDLQVVALTDFRRTLQNDKQCSSRDSFNKISLGGVTRNCSRFDSSFWTSHVILDDKRMTF